MSLRLVAPSGWLCVLLSPTLPTPIVVPIRTEPTRLLHESYSLNRDFLAGERAFHLYSLADVASRIEPRLGRAWAAEVLEVSVDLPRGWNRAALQKNAVVVVARSDPKRAIRMLTSLDRPTPPPGSSAIPEDLRSHAARVVFLEYWKAKGPSAAADIRRAARRIAENGLYPFGAVAPITLELAERNPLGAEAWWREALEFHRRGSAVANADAEFIELLDATWAALPPPLRHGFLDSVVTSLLRSPGSEVDTAYRAVVQRGDTVAEFTLRSERLLYDLIPRLREIDPSWAEAVIQKRPRLSPRGALAPEAPSYTAEIGLKGAAKEAPADYRAQVVTRALELQKLEYIEAKAKSDVDDAVHFAESLADTGVRAQAFSVIARTLGSTAPNRGRELVTRAWREVQQVTNETLEVGVLAAVADAAATQGDQTTAAAAIDRGLGLGEELFREFAETHPATPAYEAPFLMDLRRLAGVAMRSDSERVLARVRRVEERPLRAYLLIFCAEGLAEPGREPTPTVR